LADEWQIGGGGGQRVGAQSQSVVCVVEGLWPGSPADLQAQLESALRENRPLREQRDILKKRWAFAPNHRRTLWPD
jgi:hypothetical protein